MVEQFGLAIMPLCFLMSCGFTSGTTKGTFLSMRNWLVLSITTHPALAAIGAQSLLISAPGENRPICMSSKECSLTFSIGMPSILSLTSLVDKRRSLLTGKFRRSEEHTSEL